MISGVPLDLESDESGGHVVSFWFIKFVIYTTLIGHCWLISNPYYDRNLRGTVQSLSQKTLICEIGSFLVAMMTSQVIISLILISLEQTVLFVDIDCLTDSVCLSVSSNI